MQVGIDALAGVQLVIDIGLQVVILAIEAGLDLFAVGEFRQAFFPDGTGFVDVVGLPVAIAQRNVETLVIDTSRL